MNNVSTKKEIIANLKKVWTAFDQMEHELYADYVFDALELLQSQPQVVCCKDCKHYVHVRTDTAGYCTKDSSCWVFRDLDWYCADVEQRIDDA